MLKLATLVRRVGLVVGGVWFWWWWGVVCGVVYVGMHVVVYVMYVCIWDMFRTVSDLELDIDYVGGVVVV